MLFWGKPAPSRLSVMRSEHAEDCAAIHSGSFAHGWGAEEIAALLAGSTTFGAVALDPAKSSLRGFVLSRQAADEAEILTIAVAPAWRGYGVGRELLNAAKRASPGVIRLDVNADNFRALRFYKREGFTRVGAGVNKLSGRETAVLEWRREG